MYGSENYEYQLNIKKYLNSNFLRIVKKRLTFYSAGVFVYSYRLSRFDPQQ